MKQYILLDMELLKDKKSKLQNNDKLAYSLLYNRMISSVKHGGTYYDDREKNFYVIYTIFEMSEILDVSERTVGSIYKRLEKAGKIYRKKQKYSADKIFLTHFDMEDAKRNKTQPFFNNEYGNDDETQMFLNRDAENAVEIQEISNHKQEKNTAAKLSNEVFSHDKEKNIPSSYVDFNYKIKQYNTVNTEKSKKTEIEKLRTAIIGKSRMYQNAVDSVINYAKNDAAKVEEIIGVIYSAKSAVAKASGLLHAKITRFENNDHMNIGLFSRLNHIFKYAVLVQNPMGYIYNSLIKYFKAEFGLIHDEKVKPQPQRTTQGHNAPIFDCFKEDDNDIPQPKLVDTLALTETLRRRDLSDYPNNSQQSEIKERIKALLNENGIDLNVTTLPTSKNDLLNTIKADIATI